MHSILRRRAGANARRTGYIPPADGVRSDLASLSAKLPQIGSTLRNKHGVEWKVYDHTRASSIATKPGDDSEQTCYPVIFPENLSERFHALLDEVSRCTPKVILPLDTMPNVFPNRAHPGGHSIDAWSHPEAIHVFTDAEDCSEVVFAHELAHAWIDFVKGIEDHRVWMDREDTGRYTQVQLMQSFVLDFAVHKLLEEKGFDQAQIRADWEVASMQLRVAAERGFRPDNPREAIYMASHLAAVLVEESISTLPIPIANSLPMVKRNLPEIFSKASGLATAVSDSFPSDQEAALRAIDSVLQQSFAFTDPDLDYASHLLNVEPEVNWEQDKRPDWLTGQPVRGKCEIGVVMARLGATSADTPVLNRKNDLLEISFSKPDGSKTEPVRLEHAVLPPGPGDEVRRANEVIEEMRQAKKRMEEMKKLTEPKHSANPPQGPFTPQAPMPGNPMAPPGPNIPGFRPRSYSPGMARWLTKVRMEEMLAGEHPYAYALNNPTTHTDPTGLVPQDPVKEYFDKLFPPGEGIPPWILPPGINPWPPESIPKRWPPSPFWTDTWCGLPAWGYGNCCGVARKCGSGSKTYNCADEACKQHDICVGSTVGGGIGNWLPCNKQFCNDIKHCWNLYCTKQPFDWRQCQAIHEISLGFCNSFGGPSPGLGAPWK